jgi:uncharacterized membrane protein
MIGRTLSHGYNEACACRALASHADWVVLRCNGACAAGFLFDTRSDRGWRLKRCVFWPVSLAILAGFFRVQVHIDQAAHGSVQITLLSVSILAYLQGIKPRFLGSVTVETVDHSEV